MPDTLEVFHGHHQRLPSITIQVMLMRGASSGNTTLVRRALDQGANLRTLGIDPLPGVASDHHWTPLGLAVTHSHTETVRMLLVAGADPNQPDSWGECPLHQLGRKRGATEATLPILDLLLAADANRDQRVVAGDGLRPADKGAREGDTPLLTMADQIRRWPLIVRLLAADANALLTDARDNSLLHRLMVAGWNGHAQPDLSTFEPAEITRIVDTLIDQGLSSSVQDGQGQTPLDLARFINPMAIRLIRQGGQMSPETRHRLALSSGESLDRDTLKTVETSLDLLNARGPKGSTLVHKWARTGSIDCLEHWCGTPERTLHVLLETSDQHGETPLCAAIKTGQLNTVRWLIDHGAQANHCNQKGNTTLHLALGANRQPGLDDLLTLLVEHGAEADRLNAHGVSALEQQGHGRQAPWIIAWERRQLHQTIQVQGKCPVVDAVTARRRL